MAMITLNGNGGILLCLFLFFSFSQTFFTLPLDPLFPLSLCLPLCHHCDQSAVWRSDPETKGEALS